MSDPAHSQDIPATDGEAVIMAVILARAIDRAIPHEGGFTFVWTANAPEQVEAALAELGYRLAPLN